MIEVDILSEKSWLDDHQSLIGALSHFGKDQELKAIFKASEFAINWASVNLRSVCPRLASTVPQVPEPNVVGRHVAAASVAKIR